MRKTSAKRLLLSLCKWILSIGMLAYALHSIDMNAMLQMIRRQDVAIEISVILVIIIQTYILALRWQRIVFLLSHKQKKPNTGIMFRLNFINIFFNSCLPGTIGGDVVRALYLKSPDYPLAICAHSVILDRLMAIIGIFIMVVLSLPWLGKLMPSLPVSLLLGASAISTLAGIAFVFKADVFLQRLPSTHMVRMITSLIHSIRTLLKSPIDFALTMMQAIIGHACFCLCTYLLALSMGVEYSLLDSLMLVPLVILIIMMPISLGGWGIREVSMVGMLSLIGVPKEAALAISVQIGILMILASLPGAWYYARFKKIKSITAPE